MGFSLTRTAGQGVKIVDGSKVTTIEVDRAVHLEIDAPKTAQIVPLEADGTADKKRRFKK